MTANEGEMAAGQLVAELEAAAGTAVTPQARAWVDRICGEAKMEAAHLLPNSERWNFFSISSGGMKATEYRGEVEAPWEIVPWEQVKLPPQTVAKIRRRAGEALEVVKAGDLLDQIQQYLQGWACRVASYGVCVNALRTKDFGHSDDRAWEEFREHADCSRIIHDRLMELREVILPPGVVQRAREEIKAWRQKPEQETGDHIQGPGVQNGAILNSQS